MNPQRGNSQTCACNSGLSQAHHWLKEELKKCQDHCLQLQLIMKQIDTCQQSVPIPPTPQELGAPICSSSPRQEASGAVWVPCKNGGYPSEGPVAAADYSEICVARARMGENSVVPGKLVPEHGGCWVPWDNREVLMVRYEVLVSSSVKWIAFDCSEPIPDNAVPGGYMYCDEEGTREKLYIGNAIHGHEWTPGYVRESTRQLVHSSHHKHIIRSNFKLLTYV